MFTSYPKKWNVSMFSMLKNFHAKANYRHVHIMERLVFFNIHTFWANVMLLTIYTLTHTFLTRHPMLHSAVSQQPIFGLGGIEFTSIFNKRVWKASCLTHNRKYTKIHNCTSGRLVGKKHLKRHYGNREIKWFRWQTRWRENRLVSYALYREATRDKITMSQMWHLLYRRQCVPVLEL